MQISSAATLLAYLIRNPCNLSHFTLLKLLIMLCFFVCLCNTCMPGGTVLIDESVVNHREGTESYTGLLRKRTQPFLTAKSSNFSSHFKILNILRLSYHLRDVELLLKIYNINNQMEKGHW